MSSQETERDLSARRELATSRGDRSRATAGRRVLKLVGIRCITARSSLSESAPGTRRDEAVHRSRGGAEDGLTGECMGAVVTAQGADPARGVRAPDESVAPGMRVDTPDP